MLGRARMKGRRWAWAVLMFLTLVLGLWCFWIEPASLQVKAVDLFVAWPYRRPLRLAVVSDLHVGAPYHGLSRLRNTVDRINATNPDLVAILGDFVTLGVLGGRFTPPEPIAAELRQLSAPLGVFGVLGNHDRLVGGARVRRALVGAGIRVLEDTAVSVDTPEGPLWIAGVSDYWTAPHDVVRALHEVDGGGPPILLLTHNPDIFPTVPSRVMLSLAGHTHGGQVRLPVIGAPMVPSAYGQRYAAGHVVEGGRQLFVSTGIGTSDFPIRFNVPPTIFLLTLYGANRERR